MILTKGIVERRAKRDAVRAQQRIRNVDRAREMHEARISSMDNQPTLSVTDSDEAIRYHVGCSGWFYWHWKGVFYPEDLSTSDWFTHYKSKFKTVELNAPFYSWPTIATVKTWVRQAGRTKMTYTIKVSELITHTKRFVGTKSLVRDFGFIADLLGPRMGCFLFQLPPSFHYSSDALTRIVNNLEPGRKNVVEFRHFSWWNQRVFDAFKDAGVTFCSCSGPRLPDELIQTAEDVYIRFHGTKQWYRHDYSKQELAVWSDRIRNSGAKQVWAYFNNDRNGFAIKNARMLKNILSKKVDGERLTPR